MGSSVSKKDHDKQIRDLEETNASKLKTAKEQSEQALKNQKNEMDNRFNSMKSTFENQQRIQEQMMEEQSQRYDDLQNTCNSMRDDFSNRTKELNQTIEKLRKEQEEQRKEKARQKELKRKANEVAVKNLQKEISDEIIRQVGTIGNSFDKLKPTICVEEEETAKIKKLISDKLPKFFGTIKKEIKLSDILFEMLKTLNEKHLKIGKLDKFNIMVIGNTGNGKSTLINALAGEPMCFVGDGKVGTKELGRFVPKKYPFICFVDTRGTEHSKDFDISVLKETVIESIKSQLKFGKMNDNVHCLVYCVTGTRFEDVESEILLEIRDSFKSKELPIIICYTRAFSQKFVDDVKKEVFDQFEKHYAKEKKKGISGMGDDVFSVEFIDVMAKELENKPIRNLSTLVKMISRKCQFSLVSAIKESLTAKVDELFKSTVKENQKNILGNLNDLIINSQDLELQIVDFPINIFRELIDPGSEIEPEDKKPEGKKQEDKKQEDKKPEEKKQVTQKSDFFKKLEMFNKPVFPAGYNSGPSNPLKKGEEKKPAASKPPEKNENKNPEKPVFDTEFSKAFDEYNQEILKELQLIVDNKYKQFREKYANEISISLLEYQNDRARAKKGVDTSEVIKSTKEFQKIVGNEIDQTYEAMFYNSGKINIAKKIYGQTVNTLYECIIKSINEVLLEPRFGEYIKEKITDVAGKDIRDKCDSILVKDLEKIQKNSEMSVAPPTPKDDEGYEFLKESEIKNDELETPEI